MAGTGSPCSGLRLAIRTNRHLKLLPFDTICEVDIRTHSSAIAEQRMAQSTAGDVFDFDVSKLPRTRDPRGKFFLCAFIASILLLVAVRLVSVEAYEDVAVPVAILFIVFGAGYASLASRRGERLRSARFDFVRRLPRDQRGPAIRRLFTKRLGSDAVESKRRLGHFLAFDGTPGCVYRLFLRAPARLAQAAISSFEPVERSELATHWLADPANERPTRSGATRATLRRLTLLLSLVISTIVIFATSIWPLAAHARRGLWNIPLEKLIVPVLLGGAWVALLLMLIFHGESTFVVPGGLVRRRVNRLTGRVEICLFERTASILVLEELPLRTWSVRVVSGDVDHAFNAAEWEVAAILRAWRCGAGTPAIEQLREQLG